MDDKDSLISDPISSDSPPPMQENNNSKPIFQFPHQKLKLSSIVTRWLEYSNKDGGSE